MKKLDPNRSCKECAKNCPEVDFYYYPKTSKQYGSRFVYCKICWPKHKKVYDYKRRYGITPDGFNSMYEDQDGKCVICHISIIHPNDVKNNRQTHIDHDHASNKVRGLLCVLCNQGLGAFKDDPEALYRAIAYVQEHK